MRKNVTIHLDPITVPAEGNTDKELLENAKKEALKQLAIRFPRFSYAFSDSDSLTMDTGQ